TKSEDNSSAEPKGKRTFDLDFGAPVVVKTVPEAGAEDVDPKLAEITATFSRRMADQSWSWCRNSAESFPETTGKPKYLADKRTLWLTEKLEAGKKYNFGVKWPDADGPRNFVDENGVPAAPYLLVFRTKGDAKPAAENSSNASEKWTEELAAQSFDRL